MAGATTTQLGKGAKLGHATTAAPTTFVDLTRVSKISPSQTVGEVEDVTLESDWEGYLPTIGAGECTFTIRHRPGDAGVKFLLAQVGAPEVIPWRVTLPDGSKMTFTGFVKGYSKTFENKAIVDAEVPMRICTAPAYEEASGT